jgi:hypothetical protein
MKLAADGMAPLEEVQDGAAYVATSGTSWGPNPEFTFSDSPDAKQDVVERQATA